MKLGAIHKSDKYMIDHHDCKIQNNQGPDEYFPITHRTENDRMYLYQRFIDSTKGRQWSPVFEIIDNGQFRKLIPTQSYGQDVEIKLSFNPEALFSTNSDYAVFYVQPKENLPNNTNPEVFMNEMWQDFRRDVYTDFIKNITFNF